MALITILLFPPLFALLVKVLPFLLRLAPTGKYVHPKYVFSPPKVLTSPIYEMPLPNVGS